MGKGDKRRAKSPEAKSAEKTLRGRPRQEGERETNGRLKRTNHRAEERAMNQSLLTRAIHAGLLEMRPVLTKAAMDRQLKSPEDVLKAMKQPWMGCVAGRAIAMEPNAPELWSTICLVRARRRAWLKSIEAPDDFAKGQNIAAPDEKQDQGVVVDKPIDLRTPEERAIDAERAWNETVSRMFEANPLLQRVIVLDQQVSGPVGEWVKRLHKLLTGVK